MARWASARLAAPLRSSAGGMSSSTGSCSTGVGCKHPVIIRRLQFRFTSNRLVCLGECPVKLDTKVSGCRLEV